VSTKTNGPNIHPTEKGFEHAHQVRQTQTSGFERPEVKETKNSKKRKTKDGEKEEPVQSIQRHDTDLMDARGCFVTSTVNMSSSTIDLTPFDQLVRATLTKNAISSEMGLRGKDMYVGSVPLPVIEGAPTALRPPPILRQQARVKDVPWLNSLRSMWEGLPSESPVHTTHARPLKNCDISPWKDLTIHSITGGMIPSDHASVKIMLAHGPPVFTNSPLIRDITTRGHVLCIFLIPHKNSSSKKCPVAGKEHESNNIYFQFIFPVIGSLLNDETDDSYIQHTVQVMADLLDGSMNQRSRLHGWPMIVRCFREGCAKKCGIYTVSWPHVYSLLEPMVLRVLNDKGYIQDADTKKFVLAALS
jgi:hypothetical protein